MATAFNPDPGIVYNSNESGGYQEFINNRHGRSNIRDRYLFWAGYPSFRYGPNNQPGETVNPSGPPAGGLFNLSNPGEDPIPSTPSDVGSNLIPDRQDVGTDVHASCTQSAYWISGVGTTINNTGSDIWSFTEMVKDVTAIWQALNPTTSGDLLASRDWQEEGVPVLCHVGGGTWQGAPQFQTNNNNNNANWQSLGDGDMVRDIVFSGVDLGAGLPIFVGTMGFSYKNRTPANVDRNDGKNCNLRFEKMRFASEGFFFTGIQGGEVPVPQPETEEIFSGKIKIYDCSVVPTAGPPTWGGGTRHKFGIRFQWRLSPDLRGCFFSRAEEHSIYVDSPTGSFYVQNCEVDEGGNGRTFIQLVDREDEHPDVRGGYGPVVFANCIARDTGQLFQSGGSDFTTVGCSGVISYINCSSLGNWGPRNSSSARGGVLAWADDDPGHDVRDVIAPDGSAYATSGIIVSGHYFGGDGSSAPRGALMSLNGAYDIAVCSFTVASSMRYQQPADPPFPAYVAPPQMGFNRWSGGTGYLYPNRAGADPGNTPYGGVRWNFSDISGYEGWYQNLQSGDNWLKATHGTLPGTPFPGSGEVVLSDAELDAPYDGNNP